MQKLAIDSIVIDARIMVRQLNQDLASDYSVKMKEGANFPPIVVFLIDEQYYLSSGRHRYEAQKINGALEVDAIVKEGTTDEAWLFGLQDNATHGHRISHEETKLAVKRMMEHPVWKDWTNTTIAKIVGVTAMTVGRIRKKLQDEMEEQEPVKKYKTKDGTEKTVNTKQLATNKTKEPEPENEEAIGELTDVINQLTEENTKLKDAVAVGAWDATEIEKADAEELIADLRQQIATLEAELDSVKKTRDRYQKENAELIRTVKSLQKKLKEQ